MRVLVSYLKEQFLIPLKNPKKVKERKCNQEKFGHFSQDVLRVPASVCPYMCACVCLHGVLALIGIHVVVWIQSKIRLIKKMLADHLHRGASPQSLNWAHLRCLFLCTL